MTVLIYSPSIINSFISFVYCNKNDLKDNQNSVIQKLHIIRLYNGEIKMITNFHRELLFYLKFQNKQWNLYHSHKINKEYLVMNTNQLKPEYSYLGMMVNDHFEILQYFDTNGNAISFLFELGYYDPNTATYREKINKINGKAIYGKPYLLKNFNDVAVLTREGGVICINSSSYIDLIVSSLKVSKHINHTKELIDTLFSDKYYEYLEPVILNFYKRFNCLNYIKPLAAYDIVHKYFVKNDNEYFSAKMKIFRSEVLQMFGDLKNIPPRNSNTFLSNFINNLKKDICIEINTVYHRFRQFPKEREFIYNKFPNHPYIELLRMVHKHYLDNNKIKINPVIIDKFLFAPNNFTLYNEKITLLLSALSRRNELFVDTYEQFLESLRKKIEPKYKCNYNYFPFKIFSAKLFIMEHLLQ